MCKQTTVSFLVFEIFTIISKLQFISQQFENDSTILRQRAGGDCIIISKNVREQCRGHVSWKVPVVGRGELITCIPAEPEAAAAAAERAKGSCAAAAYTPLTKHQERINNGLVHSNIHNAATTTVDAAE